MNATCQRTVNCVSGCVVRLGCCLKKPTQAFSGTGVEIGEMMAEVWKNTINMGNGAEGETENVQQHVTM